MSEGPLRCVEPDTRFTLTSTGAVRHRHLAIDSALKCCGARVDLVYVHARLLSVASLLAIALFGGLHLGAPLNGDTALFHLGAERLLTGATLYETWWDLKGPGVYLVHVLSFWFFGRDAYGLHLLALLGTLVVAWDVQRLARNHGVRPVVAALAPLLVLAPPLLVSSEWHLSQPAVFAGLALYAGYRGLLSERRMGAVLGGCALVLAVSIKLSAVLPGLAMLAVHGWLAPRRSALGAAAGFVGGMALGALLLHAAGSLAGFWWTHTTFRAAAASMDAGHAARTISSTIWFLKGFGGVALLASVAAVLILRRWRRPESGLALAAAWLIFGYAGVITERFAAWPFDMFLLAIPLGILAVTGVDRLLAKRRNLAIVAAVVAVLPLATMGLSRALSPPGDTEGHAALEKTHRHFRDEGPGNAYNVGDPRQLLASGRPIASSIHGWAAELLPQEMWDRLQREFVADPPSYVYVDLRLARTFAARAPEIWKLLESRYAVNLRLSSGIWLKCLEGEGGPLSLLHELRQHHQG